MLAPTRDLVRELNRAAQLRRHEGEHPGRQMSLADGNTCTAGDVVITRRNNRRLPVGNLDWVKNGDRWQVVNVARDGSLEVQSLRSRRQVRLPASYVHEWVELGYATTIHGAQGITADTMHGLATGEESRQELYTMLTRGRQANHLYLQVVGDGDPHALAHTDSIYLLTAVERLERALTHDDVPVSATTQLREQDDPVRLLGPAVARYTDALGVAAEVVVGERLAQHLDESADRMVLWISESPAWPTLRADLLSLAADGHDPVAMLRRIVNIGELGTAHDPAAVLDHRLQLLTQDGAPGPLPWLRSIPTRVAEDPVWGPYLQARAARVADLADTVRTAATFAHVSPSWLGESRVTPNNRELAQVVGDISVWRAATEVSPDDERPTGPSALSEAGTQHQRGLEARLDQAIGNQAGNWTNVVPTLDPALARDPNRSQMARRLYDLERAGCDVQHLLDHAFAPGPLPDDHATAALWYRVAGLLTAVEGMPIHKPSTRHPASLGRPEAERRPTANPHRDGPSRGR
jgi:hypothetical protein